MSEIEIDPSLSPAQAEPAPAAEPEPEPAAEPLAAAEPATEPVAEPEPAAEPEPQPKHKGAVAELITLRREKQRLEAELSRYQADPVVHRMSPELRQAVAEGRVMVRPAPTVADAEQERLTAVAKDLGLFKADNTPDLDAAARVDRYVLRTVRQEVQPLQHMTMTQRADATMKTVWEAASAQKTPQAAMDYFHQELTAMMQAPNAPQLLSQREVVETVLERAVGRAFREGKLTPAAAPVKPQGAPAIVGEGGGRRQPAAAAIQLSPQVAALYASHGIDPNKARSTREMKYTRDGALELES